MRPINRTVAAAAALAAVLVAGLIGCGSDRPPAQGATTISNGGVQVAAIERGPAADDAPLTVLFLHGQAYDSRIWDDRGILDAVADAGYRAVAVDLPGHGDTPKREDGAGADLISDGTWLRGLIEEVGGPEHVVMVSPSMSGRYSLSYLAQFPDQALAGFVPVAPVGIHEFERDGDAVAIPALVAYGEDDDSMEPVLATRLLDQLHSGDQGTTEVIADASHAAYDDHPDEFIALLVDFLDGLERPST